MATETETKTMQDNNPISLSEEVQQQDEIQTPSTSEDDQQQDNNINENIPTDKQVIDCVEAIIRTKNKTTKTAIKTERKKTIKPKVVSLTEGQELHIKLPDGTRTCAIQFI